MTGFFLSTLSTFVHPINHPKSRSGFEKVIQKYKPVFQASKISVHRNKVRFNPAGEWNEELMDIFIKTGKDSYLSMPEFRPTSVMWNDVVSYLNRSKMENTKNNLCFRYENNYLVKAYFTFGLQYVEEGTVHVYQLTKAPMLIYFLPSRSAENVGPELDNFKDRKENGAFNAQNQYKFDAHVLEPNRVYKIPEKRYYVIVTMKSTLFSVFVARRETILPFVPSLVLNPSKLKIWKTKNEKKNCIESLECMSTSSKSPQSLCSDDGYMTDNNAFSPVSIVTQANNLDDMQDSIQDLTSYPRHEQTRVEMTHMMDTDDRSVLHQGNASFENLRTLTHIPTFPQSSAYAMPYVPSNESEAKNSDDVFMDYIISPLENEFLHISNLKKLDKFLYKSDIMDSVEKLITSPLDAKAFNLFNPDDLDEFFMIK